MEHLTSTKAGFQNLPIEILAHSFTYLRKPDELDDIRNIRLVSKRCNEVAFPLLMSFVRFYITSESLTRLQEIAQHPVFRKSIRSVEMNVSFYDRRLAISRRLFVFANAVKLVTSILSYESQFTSLLPNGHRTRIEDPKISAAITAAKSTYVEWCEQLDSGGDVACIGGQSIVIKAYDEYRQRYEDQEKVKQGDLHLRRIRLALSSFDSLKSITINDQDRRDQCKYQESESSQFSDARLMLLCLGAFAWKGAQGLLPGHETKPPVELISGLFHALWEGQIFPATFEVNITAPIHLSWLGFEEDQSRQISSILQRATDLSFLVREWSRRETHGDEHSQHLQEVIHLGRLTAAFFDTNSLKSLTLDFEGYPLFCKRPRTRLFEMLPARQWPSLRTVAFRNVSFHQEELEDFVERHHLTVTSLEITEVFLLSGTWVESVEILRRLKSLKTVVFNEPGGGGVELQPWQYPKFPKELVEGYITRGSDRNPLKEYIPDTE